MGAVREFSKAILAPLGAPAGNVETYIEVPFVAGEKKCYPDGLIRVSRGSRSWTALVEVKTGRNELQTEQLETYLDVAKEQGFDALITISNEIPAVAGQHPTKVDKRKLRKVEMYHWSWTLILATALCLVVPTGALAASVFLNGENRITLDDSRVVPDAVETVHVFKGPSATEAATKVIRSVRRSGGCSTCVWTAPPQREKVIA